MRDFIWILSVATIAVIIAWGVVVAEAADLPIPRAHKQRVDTVAGPVGHGVFKIGKHERPRTDGQGDPAERPAGIP